MEPISWRPVNRMMELEGILYMVEHGNCICGRLGREAINFSRSSKFLRLLNLLSPSASTGLFLRGIVMNTD
jgi:hypothetical protein